MATGAAIRPTLRRAKRAWSVTHEPVPGVPRWAAVAVVLIPLTVLPSSVWRIAVVWFLPPEGGAGAGDLPSWLPIEVWVLALSIGSELLAGSAFVLVAGWGEVFPRWVPGVGGKEVPVALVAGPAIMGATVLTMVTVAAAVTGASGRNVRGEPLPPDYPLHFRDLGGIVSVAAYAPLLLWGPLLAAAAVAYWRRRCRLADLEVVPVGAENKRGRVCGSASASFYRR